VNKSERNKLRKLCERKRREGSNYQHCIIELTRLIALLNALDEADEQLVVTEQACNVATKSYIEATARAVKAEELLQITNLDRDVWKARAEALERAVVKTIGYCESCVQYDKSAEERNCYFCGSHYKWQYWQFDQARFEKDAL